MAKLNNNSVALAGEFAVLAQLALHGYDANLTQKGVEYWLARDLQNLLDYDEWRNFLKVIDKARLACLNSGQNISDHFVDVNKMVLGTALEK